MTTLTELKKLAPPELQGIPNSEGYEERRKHALETVSFWHKHTAARLARTPIDNHCDRFKYESEFTSAELAFKKACHELAKERRELLREPANGNWKRPALETHSLTIPLSVAGAVDFNKRLMVFWHKQFNALNSADCKRAESMLKWVENDSDANRRKWNRLEAEYLQLSKPFIIERERLATERKVIIQQSKKGTVTK